MEPPFMGEARGLGGCTPAARVEGPASARGAEQAGVDPAWSCRRTVKLTVLSIPGSRRGGVAPVRIVLLTTLAPGGAPSGGVHVTLAISRALSDYGTVERWAVWNFAPEANKGGEWQGSLSISLARLRRHGIVRAISR